MLKHTHTHTSAHTDTKATVHLHQYASLFHQLFMLTFPPQFTPSHTAFQRHTHTRTHTQSFRVLLCFVSEVIYLFGHGLFIDSRIPRGQRQASAAPTTEHGLGQASSNRAASSHTSWSPPKKPTACTIYLCSS